MLNKIKIFLESVKFEHTVFALPFAYLGMMMAGKSWPSWRVFFWVTLAMVSARTTAMLLNRLIDLKIDAQNPRTSARPTVTGELPVTTLWSGAVTSTTVFFLSAFMLNPLCFKLSPAALVLLTGYSYVKRFSYLSHFVLGWVLSVAPVGGWLAVTGTFSWLPLLLAAAVLFWVAGFDIIYSLQDIAFDKSYGLHSIPVSFGEAYALKVAAMCHLLTLFFLGTFGYFAGLGLIYWVGLAVTALLLKVEHGLIAEADLAHIDTAFFTINGWVGVLLFVFTYLEVYR